MRKLFNKTLAALGAQYPTYSHVVAKWVISVMVHKVEQRLYEKSSGVTWVTFFDTTIGTVKGLKHAAHLLADLADKGK